ncbi:MAG: hypothetical protein GQ569_13055 [Methylococcaceae bacterium]|nr:hypothetical protein [Methylococcaceae bacterium]
MEITMKKTPLAVAIVLLATTPYALAEEDSSIYGITPSASVAFTTDYVWRGVSQSNNDAAIQGSFDLSHEMGFYVGAWGSSYEFGDRASMELDVYGGFANETDFGGTLPFALSYDVGVLRYEYTDEPDLGFTELYFGASVSPFENFNFSTYYYYGLKVDHTRPGEYTDLAADYTVPDSLGGFTLLGHAGYYNKKDGTDDYWDWKIGIAKDIGGFNFEVAYTDTDDSSNGNLDDARVVATVSRELGGSSAESASMLPEGFETSATAALTTDYIWRGVSQTNNNPAVQGSFDVAHDSGFYLGVWASNVDFGDITTPSLEIDTYIGFSRETNFGGLLPFNFTYDLGYLRYDFPSASTATINELYIGGSIAPVENLNVGVTYFYGIKTNHIAPGEYTDMGIDYTLPDALGAVTLLSHAGYYNQKRGADDYWDWKLGVAKDFGDFNFEVAYTETDDTGIDSKTDDAKVVGTISATF